MNDGALLCAQILNPMRARNEEMDVKTSALLPPRSGLEGTASMWTSCLSLSQPPSTPLLKLGTFRGKIESIEDTFI